MRLLALLIFAGFLVACGGGKTKPLNVQVTVNSTPVAALAEPTPCNLPIDIEARIKALPKGQEPGHSYVGPSSFGPGSLSVTFYDRVTNAPEEVKLQPCAAKSLSGLLGFKLP